jgi:uncharacterized membrane protein YhaH (DUF805 family)
VNLIEATKRSLSHGFDFKGRARRSEFWMFYLATALAYPIAIIVDFFTFIGTISSVPIFMLIVGLGTFLPFVACNVRRMHDVDRSGWWIFVPVAGVFFIFIEGTRGDNRFGPDSKSD